MDTSNPVVPEVERPEVMLKAKQRGEPSRLLPEQAAAFDLALKNGSAAPEKGVAVDGNMSTPVVRVLNEKGELLFEKSGQAMGERVAGNFGALPPVPPKMITLDPGAEQALWVNLWSYHDPLGFGAYTFEAMHHWKTDGAVLTSRRVPFAIVPAKVSSAALGYDSSSKMASVLAWIAAASDGKEPPKLLVRLSGFGNHANVQQGATDLGRVPQDARVAVSQIPPDGKPNWLGWVAAVSSSGVELVQHNMTQPLYRTGMLPLRVQGAVAVPRFPDRGHAVFLAVGRGSSGPELTGFTVKPGAGPTPAWVIPLASPVMMAACSFGASGPITVLMSFDDGQSTKVSRIDVSETGIVLAPEQVVRTTPNRLVAMEVDMRPNATPGFVILEQSRAIPDRLAMVRLPLSGAPPPIVPFAPLLGWPTAEDGGQKRLLPATAIDVEVGFDGVPRALVADERGRLFGGKLDGSALTQLREGGAPSLFPHIAALGAGVKSACFTQDGLLAHVGGH